MMDLTRTFGGLVLLIFCACGHDSASGYGDCGEAERSQSKIFLRQCGNQTFDPEEAACCEVQRSGHVEASLTKLLSQNVSSCCGLQAFNPLNEICCQTSVLTKTAVSAQCCGREAFDADKQLCCGPNDSKVILNKESHAHQCCERKQFNPKTQSCCFVNGSLQIVTSSECLEASSNSGEVSQMNTPTDSSRNYIETDSFGHLCCGSNGSKVMLKRKSHHHQCCGQNQFNYMTECCCEKNNGTILQVMPLSDACCPRRAINQQGSGNTISTMLYELHPGDDFHLCCGANGSKVQLPRKSLDHHCCGLSQYNEKTEKCSDSLQISPLTSSGVGDVADTVTNTWHFLPNSKEQTKENLNNHRCGNQAYNPSTHICCNGYRHTKGKNIQCCGTAAYYIKNSSMKCCMGSLYNVTSKPALCCGSRLQKKEETCCMSEDRQLLYSTKEGLQCCGHQYYNSSLWFCCFGKLTLRQQLQPRNEQIQTNGSRLLSLNNMKKWKLCKKITLGIVKSVSQHSIVMSSVMKINAKTSVIHPQPQQYVKISTDDCSLPKLSTGKVYFYDGANFYVNLDHKSDHEALYFILSVCRGQFGL